LSALPAFIFYFLFFWEKKRILGNHPKLGDDNDSDAPPE